MLIRQKTLSRRPYIIHVQYHNSVTGAKSAREALATTSVRETERDREREREREKGYCRERVESDEYCSGLESASTFSATTKL